MGRDGGDDDSIGFLPHLARYGRAMLSGMLRQWWRTWSKRRGAAETDPGTQLAAAARASGSTRPVGDLLAWLCHMGVGDDTAWELTPEDAARWLAVWRHEQARPLSFRHKRLRPYRGTEALRCGRPTFRQRIAVGALLHEDGQVLTEPAAITEALWQHRAELWTSVPEVTAGARDVLAAYFADRSAVFPSGPPVGRERLSRLILRGKGSAPGVDQEPYEVYHYGVGFVSALLAQAFHATNMDDGDPDAVLGPSVDLLIWIPKASGTQPADGMRGLQLPCCLRRHFGAGLVGEAGPPLEASFSPLQAGVRGRNCGGNPGRRSSTSGLHSGCHPGGRWGLCGTSCSGLPGEHVPG